jgi:predicted DNA-binding protein
MLQGETNMDMQMLVRIDGKTKEKLARLARKQGKSSSQMVREILGEYVNNRDIEGYIDDLWRRIGQKLRAKKARPADVAAAIAAERRQAHESRR